MRKAIFSMVLLAMCSISVAQTTATTKDGKQVVLNEDGTWKYVQEKTDTSTSTEETGDIYIIKEVDDMTDKVYYYMSKGLLCVNDEQNKGFRVNYSFSAKGGVVKIDGLSVKSVGLGCVKATSLIFLFEDGSKINITSWNDFNCKGNSWFMASAANQKKLAEKKIAKIRVQNGDNGKSYTQELTGADQSYFINSTNALKNKDFRPKK